MAYAIRWNAGEGYNVRVRTHTILSSPYGCTRQTITLNDNDDDDGN